MDRRSFFGFIPAAIAGVALGAGHALASEPRGFFKVRTLKDVEREQFWRMIADHVKASREILDSSPSLQSHIDNHLRIDLKRLAKVQAELAIYPPLA